MIQSVERAAAILRVLGSGTPRLGVTEIAGLVGLPKPTVYGLLRTLVNHDLVAQDPDTGKYSLGAGVLQLGNAFLDGSELRARSLLWAEALAQRANEAVWVATLSGTRVIVLHHVFRPDNTVQILEVGAAIPWHACALGHAIVAYLPPPEAARAMAGDLPPLTGRTKTTKAALGQRLAQVRRRGYAVEDQEATVGDAGIAAPIVNRAGATVGSIGLVGRPNDCWRRPRWPSWPALSWSPPGPSPGILAQVAVVDPCCPYSAEFISAGVIAAAPVPAPGPRSRPATPRPRAPRRPMCPGPPARS